MSLSHGILPGMPVICSEGMQFATVDHMEGSNQIKLKKDENGQHHFIPVSWVAATDNAEIKLDRPHEEAMQQWFTKPLPDQPHADEQRG
ncbi:DUF2171 domain-containing protein [Methylobacillus sp.]|uniref:DUF2171 domain-containing protein n=1 Tax=Methylobacillus sp. TaxID=56818 RepID=UPI002FE1E60E